MESYIIDEAGNETLADFDAPKDLHLFDIVSVKEPGDSGNLKLLLLINRIWYQPPGGKWSMRVSYVKFDCTAEDRLKKMRLYGYVA